MIIQGEQSNGILFAILGDELQMDCFAVHVIFSFRCAACSTRVVGKRSLAQEPKVTH